jgi:leader peptidase (prepilin peptidase)/N-methyltransferase
VNWLTLDHLVLGFCFALGACVGSFVNVVAYRWPRGLSVVHPPSACPKCGKQLGWGENLPILGWFILRGRCRGCRGSISFRYPAVELLAACLFAGMFIAMFWKGMAPASPWVLQNRLAASWPGWTGNLALQTDWPIFALYLFAVGCLLAISLVDLECYMIPLGITWMLAGVGMVTHALIAGPHVPGALIPGQAGLSVAFGGAAGLLISILLLKLGVFRQSYASGAPLLEVERESLQVTGDPQGDPAVDLDFTRRDHVREMIHEVIFLLPPIALAAVAYLALPGDSPAGELWQRLVSPLWVQGLLGSILGGLIGAFVVWLTRIVGTIGFGREAMGLGDVHLMFGAGAVIGAAPATVAFFVAPFFGIAVAVYLLVTGKRRELPYGPYLAMGVVAMMLFYPKVHERLAPGFDGLWMMLSRLFGA